MRCGWWRRRAQRVHQHRARHGGGWGRGCCSTGSPSTTRRLRRAPPPRRCTRATRPCSHAQSTCLPSLDARKRRNDSVRSASAEPVAVRDGTIEPIREHARRGTGPGIPSTIANHGDPSTESPAATMTAPTLRNTRTNTAMAMPPTSLRTRPPPPNTVVPPSGFTDETLLFLRDVAPRGGEVGVVRAELDQRLGGEQAGDMRLVDERELILLRAPRQAHILARTGDHERLLGDHAGEPGEHRLVVDDLAQQRHALPRIQPARRDELDRRHPRQLLVGDSTGRADDRRARSPAPGRGRPPNAASAAPPAPTTSLLPRRRFQRNAQIAHRDTDRDHHETERAEPAPGGGRLCGRRRQVDVGEPVDRPPTVMPSFGSSGSITAT